MQQAIPTYCSTKLQTTCAVLKYFIQVCSWEVFGENRKRKFKWFQGVFAMHSPIILFSNATLFNQDSQSKKIKKIILHINSRQDNSHNSETHTQGVK